MVSLPHPGVLQKAHRFCYQVRFLKTYKHITPGRNFFKHINIMVRFKGEFSPPMFHDTMGTLAMRSSNKSHLTGWECLQIYIQSST